MGDMVLNAFALCDTQEMSELLKAMCGTGLTEPQAAFMGRQIAVLAPALVFLRDERGMEVNALKVAEHATETGFLRLAEDPSLPADLREGCAAMHREMTAMRDGPGRQTIVALLRW